MKKLWNLALILGVIFTFQACKIADLRTTELNESTPLREERAIQLLDKVIAKYNLQKLAAAENYSVKAVDNWRGLYAIVNPFPQDNELMELRFRPGSFDGQFNYLKGRNSKIYGVQSFQYYRIDGSGEVKFKKKKSITFALPALQYFIELPLRLRNAPILKYAGTREFENRAYDLVFATWDRLEPHKGNDQYLLYFDKQTGDLSFASYTVRGMYLPAPRSVFGSIRFSDLHKSADGITFPRKLFIQLNQLKKENRTLHTVTLSDLNLNDFELSTLYPDAKLEYIGDSKN